MSYELHKSTIPEEDVEAGPAEPPGPLDTGPPAAPSTRPPPSPGTRPPTASPQVPPGSLQPGPLPPGPQVPEVTPDKGLTPPLPTKQNIQVSTITKTLPDGRRVQTRIVRGPVQRKARIIKINRELPNGETELLSTLQLPGDQEIDIDETVKNIVSGGGAGGRQVTIETEGGKRRASTEYDNVPRTATTPTTPIQNHVGPPGGSLAPLADISEELRPVQPRRQSLKEKFKDKFR